MRRAAVFIALSCSSLACTGPSQPAKPGEANATGVSAEAEVVEAPRPPPAPEAKAPEPAKAPEVAVAETKPEPPVEALPPPPAEALEAPAGSTGEEPGDAAPDEAAAANPVPEIAIKPWAITPRTNPWTLVAEPAAPLVLTDLTAGVLGRAGTQWWQLGDDGVLATVAMNPEPELPVLGVWPGDAWFVNRRFRKYDREDDQEYLELRLMKLRGTSRWVPQVYSGSGEQWFHPGTDDEVEPHISAVSGMLVYPRSLADITRVAGRIPDPVIGPHRGDAIDFLEAASGKVHVISRDADGTYAQIQCEDDACVAASTNRLPLSRWSFGRRLARGKHSVTVLASSESREFMLHHKGKAEGWSLDELPAGEKPNGMWASAEGGLWTLTDAHLRWRDIDGGWFEVALPDGLTSPSVAVTVDRTRVLVSGVVGGAAKLFSTHANARP